MEPEEDEEDTTSKYTVLDIITDVLNRKSKVGLVTLNLSDTNRCSAIANDQRESISGALSLPPFKKENSKNIESVEIPKVTTHKDILKNVSRTEQPSYPNFLTLSHQTPIFRRSSYSDSVLDSSLKTSNINSGKCDKNIANYTSCNEEVNANNVSTAQPPPFTNFLTSSQMPIFRRSDCSVVNLDTSVKTSDISSLKCDKKLFFKCNSIREEDSVQTDENRSVKSSMATPLSINTRKCPSFKKCESSFSSTSHRNPENKSNLSRDESFSLEYNKIIKKAEPFKMRNITSDRLTEFDKNLDKVPHNFIDLLESSSHSNKTDTRDYKGNSISRQASNINENKPSTCQLVSKELTAKSLLCDKPKLLKRNYVISNHSIDSKLYSSEKANSAINMPDSAACAPKVYGTRVQKEQNYLPEQDKGTSYLFNQKGSNKEDLAQSKFVTPFTPSAMNINKIIEKPMPDVQAKLISAVPSLRMADIELNNTSLQSSSLQNYLRSSDVVIDGNVSAQPLASTIPPSIQTLVTTVPSSQSLLPKTTYVQPSVSNIQCTPVLPNTIVSTLPTVTSQMPSSNVAAMPPILGNIDTSHSNPNIIQFDMSKIITVNGRQFIKQRKIGKGGSSIVLSVLDLQDLKNKALKIVTLQNLDEAILKSHLDEIYLLKKLEKSPRVIKLYDFERTADELKIVMEIGSLDFNAIISNAKKNASTLNAFTIKHYWNEMLLSVQDIHKEGIIHSDLKPANFLLVGSTVKLIDFGIASSIQKDMTSVFKDNQVGTLNYMSPESLTCVDTPTNRDSQTIKIGVKSDIWSLGCILYVLAYGKSPFQHVTNMYKKISTISNPNTKIHFPPTLNDVNLLDVLQKCLQFNAKDRPSINHLLEHPYLKSS